MRLLQTRRQTVKLIKMIRRLLCFNYVIIYFYSTTAQLSQMETLRNITACDLNVDIQVTCAADEMIALHSLQYAYNVGCGGTCCPYTSTDCFVNAGDTDIQDIRRPCSGRSSCNLPISTDKTDFATCSLGVLDISYVFLQYYCIPNDRISSICASGQTITSDGAPIYLTNENYPSVTTGSTSCSCSLEVYSCSSSINLYTVDADLYLDTNTCLQNLNFLNGSDQTLQRIGCESHYLDQIEINTVNSHYLKIDFINNSTANQEGYFFIGLKASESGASFSLSCNYEQETWCIGCGAVPDITHGQVALTNVNDASYGAEVAVTCDSGYETQTSAINCLANGSWPVPVCTQKAACTASQWRCSNGDCIEDSQRCDNSPDCSDLSDEDSCGGTSCPEGLELCPHGNGTDVCVDKAVGCSCGSVPSISNGVITTGTSTIGSVADVTCAEGYNPSAPNVTCLTSGSWETASCTAEETNGSNGNGEDNSGNTDESKEKEGGLAAWIIAVIVIVVVLVVIVVGAFLYVKCIKNQDITPEDSERKLPLGNQIADSVQPQIVPTEESNAFSKSKPLPEITKQHEISHGHVYIDHGDAHIFGITIHLPFGKKPTNRLTPIKRAENG